MVTGHPHRGHIGPVAERADQLRIRYAGGPWHGATWTPRNPRGVLAVHRIEGWAGAYRRARIAADGAWLYQWTPDPPNPPPPPEIGATV